MSSFAELKASREARQRPRTAHLGDVPSVKPAAQQSAAASPLPDESTTPTTLVTDLPGHVGFPSSILQVRQTREAGKSVYLQAESSVKRGQSLINTNPISACLSNSQLSSRCSHCWLDQRELAVQRSTLHEYETQGDLARRKAELTGEATLSRCSGCKVVRYCSQQCQAAAWPSHSSECRSFKRLKRVYHASAHTRSKQESEQDRLMLAALGQSDPDDQDLGWIPPEEVRALGRLCWARRAARKKGSEEEAKYWAPIASLQSHLANATTTQREALAQLALKLNQYLASGQPLKPGEKVEELIPVDMGEFGFSNVAEVMNLCSAFTCNSFTLSSSTLEPVGVAISPLVALFNHSCVPNAVVVFPNGGNANDGRGMTVVALRDLKAGEEVLTSYIDVSSPYHTRQQELSSRYYFTCKCTLCQADGNDKRIDPRWALRHPDCGELMRVPDLKTARGSVAIECTSCATTWNVDVDKLAKVVEFAELLLQEEEHGLLGDFHASKVGPVTDALCEYFPPSSHPLQPLLRLRSLLSSRPSPPGPDAHQAEPPQTVIHLMDAVESQALAWKGMQLVYPDGHPSLGLALAVLGKLLNLDAQQEPKTSSECGPNPSSSSSSSLAVGQSLALPVQATDRLGLARETLVMALQQLRIGFGHTGGLAGREIEGILDGVTREMKFKGLIE